jgi:hypothetical protein
MSSCPGNKSLTIGNSSTTTMGANSSMSNNTTNNKNNSAQYNNNLTAINPFYNKNKCRKILKTYPSFRPTINTLSTTSSVKGAYSVVYINGSNFLPQCIGVTYVNFGAYKNLPIIFFSSTYISFTIPLNAAVGNYSVVVVNVYNGNFSQQVNTSYPGILNYSNQVTYSILL